jgi:hypothetical protein
VKAANQLLTSAQESLGKSPEGSLAVAARDLIRDCKVDQEGSVVRCHTGVKRAFADLINEYIAWKQAE